MTDLASYIFSTYSTILSLSKEELLQVGYHTNDSTPIPSFDQELLIFLCSEAQAQFTKEDIVLKVDGDVIVIGDIHGSLHDLLRIINSIDISHHKVVFLGDYVDRGNFSLECITLLFALKILYPNNYYLLRGNHEFDVICSQYGFKNEFTLSNIPKGNSLPKFTKYKSSNLDSPDSNKSSNIDDGFPEDDYFGPVFKTPYILRQYHYNETLYQAFIKAFSYLPLCAIINNTSICLHGGISPQLAKVDDIRNSIQRPIDNFDNELLCDLLWGDPSKRSSKISGFYQENPRGKGKIFSGVAVSDFLKNNFLRRLIRGHECVNSGIESRFNDKCITVFSASSYNKEMGNKSGILKVYKEDDRIETQSFSPIMPLKRTNANFFRVQPFFEKDTSLLPSKPFFTMTTVRPPIGKCRSQNSHELKDVVAGLKKPEELTCSAVSLKSPNGCPIVALNRKPKVLTSNLRKLNSSFQFNTGIRNARRQSSSCLNQMQQRANQIQKQNLAFQSDNQAEFEVERMEQEENEQEVPNLPQKILPKLVKV